MHRLWDRLIEPLLDAGEATTVVEIGVDSGAATRLLLDRAKEIDGGVVHAIDPVPKLDVERWEAEYGALLCFHREKSHEALPQIGAVDAALIDGDHNWFTVTGELQQLAATAAAQSAPMPLVMAHDVGWPYGRRDMYYDPDSIPFEARHDAARSGLAPGQSELSDDGINPWMWNATHEGKERNGVRTAIEDFASTRREPCELLIVEGFHGLGLLASHALLEVSPGLKDALDHLRSAEFAREWAQMLERARIDAEITAWQAMGRPGPEH